ncbi:hypothetical protein HELRODRAFT_174982 [Helobdella robusta]|uniref:Uncharacterized protein n=1 Tax=Helobdella robusta TaxID=6412 RepID=T1F8P2_HELRO|nr:hypothetical protein HELRODRAFT_174982 [Helobdella robusta]ESO01423.1 hypothetical protein HELRODRAFT_174982 [Helobdella robusta]
MSEHKSKNDNGIDDDNIYNGEGDNDGNNDEMMKKVQMMKMIQMMMKTMTLIKEMMMMKRPVNQVNICDYKLHTQKRLLDYDSGNGEDLLPGDSNQLSPGDPLAAGSVERFSDNLTPPNDPNHPSVKSDGLILSSSLSKDSLSPSSSFKDFSQQQLQPRQKTPRYKLNHTKHGKAIIFCFQSNNNNNLQKQLTWMQRNMDMLKQENAALEKALTATGRPNDSRNNYNDGSGWMIEQAMDPTPLSSSATIRPNQNAALLSSFKIEMATFKSELSRVSSSLEACELGRKSLSDKWVTSLQASLQQMNAALRQLLVQNLENPIEKSMISSLQGRLKSTEERLRINRREGVDNLSKAEERLLIENANYQTSENELRRKVHQMNSQLENIRRKQHNLVEVFQRLKVKASENGHIDVTELLKRYMPADFENSSSGDSSRKQPTTTTQFSSSSGLNNDSIQQPDLSAAKNQIASLVKEKHSLASDISNLNDENILMKLENDRLKKSLNELNTTWKMDVDEFKSNQNNTISRILKQVERLTNEARQLCWCNEQSVSIVKILEDVITTKERLLTSALVEIDRMRSLHPPPSLNQAGPQSPQAAAIDKKQNDKMSAILEFMRIRHEGENKIQESTTNITSQIAPLLSPSSQSNELLQLNSRCSKLENDLEFAEKNLEFQKDQVAKLQTQLHATQDELRRQKQILDISQSNETDLRRELKMNKEWLDAVNTQLIEKDKQTYKPKCHTQNTFHYTISLQLKLAELDRGSVSRLMEKDKLSFDSTTATTAAAAAADSTGGNDVRFIRQALELDIMASKNALDTTLKENIRLKMALEQAARDLVIERDVTSSATYDKMALQQQLYTSLEEKANEAKEREKLQMELALLKLENQKLTSTLLQQTSSSSSSTTSPSQREKELREAYDGVGVIDDFFLRFFMQIDVFNVFLRTFNVFYIVINVN